MSGNGGVEREGCRILVILLNVIKNMRVCIGYMLREYLGWRFPLPLYKISIVVSSYFAMYANALPVGPETRIQLKNVTVRAAVVVGELEPT